MRRCFGRSQRIEEYSWILLASSGVSLVALVLFCVICNLIGKGL